MRSRGTRIARRPGRLIALAGALVALPNIVSAQVAVDELELRVSARPSGTSTTTTFHAANRGITPANATITIQDWDRSEAGENRYYPTGTLTTSCGKHVSVFPSVLQLAPRSVQTIRVTVDSGAAIGHGCYAILFVDNPPPPRTAQSTAVQYSVRYGVKVYVEPETPLSGEVTDVGVSETKANIASGKLSAQAGGRTRQLDITYKNTGARQTIAHGAVEIRRPDNSVVSKIDIPEFPTLPGATRRLGVALPNLPSGRYVLLALLDYEGAEIAAGQVELDIP
jgi:P pilus assembly chaperone PapD